MIYKLWFLFFFKDITTTDLLHQIEIPIKELEECKDPTFKIKEIFEDEQICAGVLKGETLDDEEDIVKDSCQVGIMIMTCKDKKSKPNL